jgi:hypothetical protein
VQVLRGLLHPYLSLFRLDTTWNFFAPSVGRHAQFRYVIEDSAGTEHTFVPTEESSWFLPRYVWWREFKYLYDGVMESSDTRGDSVAALLCRMHASLEPVAVTLLQLQEQDFWPEDYLLGKRPLDPEYVSLNALTRVACGGEPASPRHSPIRPVRKPLRKPI